MSFRVSMYFCLLGWPDLAQHHGQDRFRHEGSPGDQSTEHAGRSTNNWMFLVRSERPGSSSILTDADTYSIRIWQTFSFFCTARRVSSKLKLVQIFQPQQLAFRVVWQSYSHISCCFMNCKVARQKLASPRTPTFQVFSTQPYCVAL